MRYLLLLVLIITGCSTYSQTAETEDSPCKDELYLELKEIPLDDMSDREYETYHKKEQACQMYMAAMGSLDRVNKAQSGLNAAVFIGLFTSLAATIYLFHAY